MVKLLLIIAMLIPLGHDVVKEDPGDRLPHPHSLAFQRQVPKPKPVVVKPVTHVSRSEVRVPWAQTYKAVRVANCESGGGPSDTSPTYDGDAHLNDPNGHYGKWQFDFGTWASVGGHGNPAFASEAEQDYRAYRLFLDRGWQPWECAGMI